jgi:hypothetical protein
MGGGLQRYDELLTLQPAPEGAPHDRFGGR